MLDLFAGWLGWSKAFLARGWKVTAVDLVRPPEIPEGVEFMQKNILTIGRGWDFERWMRQFDFACASSPCEGFAKFGMRHFFPEPPYPAEGIRLFNHTRELLESSAVPYVMENVRAAQEFVGPAKQHCGSFYLWGNSVPPILPQGITKGVKHAQSESQSERDSRHIATIPPELANCVAEYAERLLETKVTA